MNLLDKFLLCPPIWIIRITAASILSLFSIYTAFFGVFPDMIQRSFHIGIILFLVYLFPLQNLSYNDLLRSFKSYLFMILSLLSLLVMLYQIIFPFTIFGPEAIMGTLTDHSKGKNLNHVPLSPSISP